MKKEDKLGLIRARKLCSIKDYRAIETIAFYNAADRWEGGTLKVCMQCIKKYKTQCNIMLQKTLVNLTKHVKES